MAQYIAWAKAIQTDSKTTQLLAALEIGFRALAQTGAASKALIFNESRRTQAYLLVYWERTLNPPDVRP